MEANTWIKQIQYDREKDKPSTLVTTDGWSYTEDSEAGKRAILEQNHRVTLTTNGVHSVNPESGFEGMKKATVTVNVPSSGPNTLYAWFPLDGSITRPAYTVSLPPIGDVNVAFIIAGPTGSTMARYDTATVNASGNLEFTINGTAYEYTRTGHGTTYDINLT